MAHNQIVHGYKGFENDMTCRGVQYEPGKVYEMDGEIKPCERGFHFCRNMTDVFEHYQGNDCRYAEVEALGKVIDGKNKSVTDKLRIVRELTQEEVFKETASCAGISLEPSPFPADEIIKARDAGTLGEMLPSETEFPVRFANGEWNVLVVCRDRDHTYMVTKYLMAEPFAMNGIRTNEGGWPACGMRKHVQGIYDMLPEDIRRVVIPMHIKQAVQNEVVECNDSAFLLSSVNVFGKNVWSAEADCDDLQIDIFLNPAAGIKRRFCASSASWWWLRSANYNYSFLYVASGGNAYEINEGGVVVAFCNEDRSPKG